LNNKLGEIKKKSDITQRNYKKIKLKPPASF